MHEQFDRVLERARRRHRAAVHEEDLVGVLDGVEAVRDDHLGRARRQLLQRALEQLFGHGVDVGGRFIEVSNRLVP